MIFSVHTSEYFFKYLLIDYYLFTDSSSYQVSPASITGDEQCPIVVKNDHNPFLASFVQNISVLATTYDITPTTQTRSYESIGTSSKYWQSNTSNTKDIVDNATHSVNKSKHNYTLVNHQSNLTPPSSNPSISPDHNLLSIEDSEYLPLTLESNVSKASTPESLGQNFAYNPPPSQIVTIGESKLKFADSNNSHQDLNNIRPPHLIKCSSSYGNSFSQNTYASEQTSCYNGLSASVNRSVGTLPVFNTSLVNYDIGKESFGAYDQPPSRWPNTRPRSRMASFMRTPTAPGPFPTHHHPGSLASAMSSNLAAMALPGPFGLAHHLEPVGFPNSSKYLILFLSINSNTAYLFQVEKQNFKKANHKN